ncbi:MAG: glycosyltransferase [Acidobacteria bacterium]|nr:glycosyltransferase [Acidobacteriota bacterium]
MNILFLTQVLPYPLDAGPKTRAYLVLRHLAESGHEVTLVSFTRADDRPESIEHLRRYCREIYTVRMQRSRIRDGINLLQSLVLRRPFLVARDWVPAMAHTIRAVAGKSPRVDAIHADQLWMAPYALFASKCLRGQRRPWTVLDQHNAVFNIPRRMADSESSFWKRALLHSEARKLARYERSVCRGFDRVVWVTAEDREAVLARDAYAAGRPALREVIPIALDLSSRRPFRQGRKARRVTFMGGLHWPPNEHGVRWFRDEIWPRVRKQAPEAVLTIIGKQSSEMAGDGSGPAVVATGYLPDPTSYLEETAVFIVPLLAGGGMRVKILDAWSWGLPVVSTSVGAEGIRAVHGENIWLADNSASFASGVIDLYTNPVLADRLAEGGRRTLEAHYDWRKAYRAWDRIYSFA